MMILRSSPASPFARKVRIAISLLGLADKIEVTATNLDDAADSVRIQNPIGKIPVLVLEDGTAYYDSRVILDYLDHLAGGGRIVPREPKARFEALRLQALCDGIMDASLMLVYEGRYRPAEMKVQSWLDRQNDKARADGAGSGAAGVNGTARRRPDRARLPARLSRSAVRRHVAEGLSEAGRLARQVRRTSAGLRRDQVRGLTIRNAKKKPRRKLRGFVFDRPVLIRSGS
jgi:glutathione S-transferase